MSSGTFGLNLVSEQCVTSVEMFGPAIFSVLAIPFWSCHLYLPETHQRLSHCALFGQVFALCMSIVGRPHLFNYFPADTCHTYQSLSNDSGTKCSKTSISWPTRQSRRYKNASVQKAIMIKAIILKQKNRVSGGWRD